MVRGMIRFTGFIQGHKIQILIDGGSSDNFIQPRVAKFLHLPIYQTPRLKVLVGNEEQLECEGEVQNIPVQIQGILCIFQLMFYLSLQLNWFLEVNGWQLWILI